MMKPHPTTPEPTASSTWERLEEFGFLSVRSQVPDVRYL
jgi:hypothetical protein